MFGNFFSSLGEKLQVDPKDRGEQDQVADLFSQLTQPQNSEKGGNGRAVAPLEDPFSYFSSPERQTTKPHVSKQKPAIFDNSQGDSIESLPASKPQMQSLPLFADERQKKDARATEHEPSAVSSNMWAADDDSEFSSEIESPEPVNAPSQSLQTEGESAPRKRDYLSSLVSRAGTLIKKSATTMAQSASPAADAAEAPSNTMVSTLTQENQLLRESLEKQQTRVEDLQEEIEVHQSLEEEAHENNEELLFKVKYLEELARENGADLSSLKRIDELAMEKKSLQSQVTGLERQMRLLEKTMCGKDSAAAASDEEEIAQMLEKPKRMIQDLKSLFEHNRIQFSKSDEARVITAIYTQDKPVIRLYREILYRRIAEKAIATAESLFKQTNSVDRSGNIMCKLLLENRQLQTQNGSLKKRLAQAKRETDLERETRLDERVRWKHKLGRVCDKAKSLASEVAQMRSQMQSLCQVVHITQSNLDDDEMITMNGQKFNSFLQFFLSEQTQQVAEVQKQLMEQTSATQKEKEKLDEQLSHGREVFEQLCQVQSDKAGLFEELAEAQETINHMEEEINRLHDDHQKSNTQSNMAQTLLQQEIQVLQQEKQSWQQDMATSTAPHQKEACSPETRLQINELEKMLEEREEEILELMQEVNKLQAEKQQSPEVVNTLQILKSKLATSQQRFHDQQHMAPKQFSTGRPQQRVEEQSTNLDLIQEKLHVASALTTQHVPILIVDEAGEKSSQGSHLEATPSGQSKHQQAAAAVFNQDVSTRLEEVQQERLALQQSPELREPFSRIVRDGKESNFFSSLVETSTEKGQPEEERSKKVNDLFGFLMEPSQPSSVQKSKGDALNGTGDNWSEAFGFPGLSQTSSKQNLAGGLKLKPLELDSQDKSDSPDERQTSLGWGDQDEEDIELTEQANQIEQKAKHEAAQEDALIDEISPSGQTGEIMLQESLENSPIRTGRSTEVEDQAQNSNIRGSETSEVVRNNDSLHKRQKELPTEASLNNSMELVGRETVSGASEQRQLGSAEQVQRDSYMAAIESMQQDDSRQNQDISSEVYERLMEGDISRSQSESDSMLHSSPFNNSFTRQEVDMVVTAIRKNSLTAPDQQTSGSSPLLPEEKKVNISNLSDLVPEDPIPERLNDTDEDLYTRMMRPGELNEVAEVEEPDEDVSDDPLTSPRDRVLPQQIHNRAGSATILDAQGSDVSSRKASIEMPYAMITPQAYRESPSLLETSKFEVGPGSAEEDEPTSRSNDNQDTPENAQEKLILGQGEVLPSQLQLTIQTSSDISEKRVTSARSHHRRQESIDENPFHAMSSQSVSQSTTPRPQYETLAEFTKDNLISYEADGKTISAAEVNHGENTAEFDNSQQSDEVQNRNEDFMNSRRNESDDDRPPEVTNVNASGFFSRDFRVLKNATYGNPNQGDMIMKKLVEEYGTIDDSHTELAAQHEQNVQSFAEPPPEEPSVEETTEHQLEDELQNIGNQMIMQNMSRQSSAAGEGSIENSFKDSFNQGSIVDNSRLQNFMGSLIQHNISVEENDLMQLMQSRTMGENSLDEMDDGIPQVDEYTEQTSGSIHQPTNHSMEQIEQVALPMEQQAEVQVQEVEMVYEDAQSLETVSVAQSAEVSPVKIWPQSSRVPAEPDNEEVDNDQVVVKSNQQDSGQEISEPVALASPENHGAGWEGDESLEEIQVDSFDEAGQNLETSSQHHSVSGNEQVSDAVEQAPLQPKVALEKTPERAFMQDTPSQGMDDPVEQLMMQSQSLEQRRDTPIPFDTVESGSKNEQYGKDAEVRGWAEESDDVSIDPDSGDELGMPVQEQNLQNLNESLSKVDNSLTCPEQLLGEGDLDEIGETLGTEESTAFVSAAQNEQAEFLPDFTQSKPQAAQPNFEEMFALVEQKQAEALADPFSMLLGDNRAAEESKEPQVPSTTEVGGTGGGWDDDEDDIDID